MFENPRRGRQARNFTANVPKIVDLKSSSEQIFSENCRWVPLLRLTHNLYTSSYSINSNSDGIILRRGNEFAVCTQIDNHR